MDTGVVVVLVLAGLGAAYLWNKAHEQGYREGKHEGSRKGFGVGYDRGRRAGQNVGGCSLLVVTLTLLGSVLATLSYAAFR